MRIGINIDGQFVPMTGIQHNVDSLLGALYRLPDVPHEICAFAPWVASEAVVDNYAAKHDGTFEWRHLPGAKLDLMIQPKSWVPKRFAQNHPWLTHKIHLKEAEIRGRRSSSPYWRASLYDVFHNTEPCDLSLTNYKPKHTVNTLHDLATRVCPWAYTSQAIHLWEGYFEHAQNKCDVLLAVSEATKHDVVKELKIPADRVFVAPNAARASSQRMEDGPQRQSLLKKWNLTGDTPFILYGGTLEPRKNCDKLVKAFAEMIRSHPSLPHKLVLAGGNWNRLDLDLRVLAVEEGMAGRVITTGYVSNDEMNALMSACEAFAYISQYEGFGMPLLEAMVCGAPVVTSNLSCMPEVVGNAGVLVSPSDINEIAEALFVLVTDEKENLRRRALSQTRAKDFSWEKTARLTLAAYEAAAS